MGKGLRILIVAAGIAAFPTIAFAGMAAVPTLTEMARMRLETLSFFLIVLLVSALLVMLIWNGLRGSFPRLPHLNYRRALGVVVLWGLLFLIVLLMVSAARELMTPGAWEKQGVLYHLKEGK